MIKKQCFKNKKIPCVFAWSNKSFFPVSPCKKRDAKTEKKVEKKTFCSTSYSETLLTNIFHFIPEF